ncbi:MAG: hypothetical protein ACKO40_16425 [Planctomycetaceae bacterium]
MPWRDLTHGRRASRCGASDQSLADNAAKKREIFPEVLLTVFPHIIHNSDIGVGSMVSDHR